MFYVIEKNSIRSMFVHEHRYIYLAENSQFYNVAYFKKRFRPVNRRLPLFLLFHRYKLLKPDHAVLVDIEYVKQLIELCFLETYA